MNDFDLNNEKKPTDMNELEIDFGDPNESFSPTPPLELLRNLTITPTQAPISPVITGSGSGAELKKTNAEISSLRSLFEENFKLLKTLFETKIMSDAQKDKLISSMHDELESYKADFYSKIFMPVLNDMILLKEDMHKLCRDMSEKNPESQKLCSIIDGYALDVGDILEKYGVQMFACAGDSYVPVKQKSVKLVETADPALNGRICRRISNGYAFEGRVLRPERVSVYRYTLENADNSIENGGENNV